MKQLLRQAFCLVSISFFSTEASATWSIVVANRATGEVAVGSATCWDGQWLERLLPVVVPGVGVANNQATVDSSGQNRRLIWDELRRGTDPAAILALVQAQDGLFQNRQIAIVDLNGRSATHTGTSIPDAWNGHQSGANGDLIWSIQGNRLAGSPVIAAARYALLNTPGDLAERLMAAMLAARYMGGDGRCSCSTSYPASCGSPPPSFSKSAHVGFMIVARVGDLDGICDASSGCATGRYFMNLEVGGWQGSQPDPVLQLQSRMTAWRATLDGRPDQQQSTVHVDPIVLRSDGTAAGRLEIRLRDWRGLPLTHGGAQVTVTGQGQNEQSILFGEVTDHADGTYSLPLVTGIDSDLLTVRCVVDDGSGPITLYPFTEVAVAPADGLAADTSSISSSQGGQIRFDIDLGWALGGRPYVLLCSASGTVPGFHSHGTYIPLVYDNLVLASFLACGSARLPNSCGLLDPAGRGLAGALIGPGELSPLYPGELSFALVSPGYASNPVVVTIAP